METKTAIELKTLLVSTEDLFILQPLIVQGERSKVWGQLETQLLEARTPKDGLITHGLRLTATREGQPPRAIYLAPEAFGRLRTAIRAISDRLDRARRSAIPETYDIVFRLSDEFSICAHVVNNQGSVWATVGDDRPELGRVPMAVETSETFLYEFGLYLEAYPALIAERRERLS